MSPGRPLFHGKKVQELWILAGVTAAGKTEFSLQWAEKYDAEIISCDSVSFYRGLNIGSAKPSKEEQGRVVHHGLDMLMGSKYLMWVSFIPMPRK